MNTRFSHAAQRHLALAAFCAAVACTSVLAQPVQADPGFAAERHAQAQQSFRQARFSEAYGRFIEAANAGHDGAAEMALWMCRQGPTLFAKDWDCHAAQVQQWMAQAGEAPQQMAARTGTLR